MSQEECQDYLCVIYGLMPQDIPATYDGCSKEFLIKHALSCPKGGLILERQDDATKGRVAIGARAPTPSTTSYKNQINSRTLEGGTTGDGERQGKRMAEGGTEITGVDQGGRGNGRSVNKLLGWRGGQDRYQYLHSRGQM